MVPRKVLIADPAEEFSRALTAALSPDLEVRCCSRGEEVLELTAQWQPDLLVLELRLHSLDGLTVLRRLAGRGKLPPVLVTSAMLTDYAVHNLVNLGVQYALQKPCRLDAAVEQVHQILNTKAEGDTPIVRKLRELGIPYGRQGSFYLVTALELLTLQRDQRLSKELYAEVAKRHCTTVASVEKGIRDMLLTGWISGDPEAWRQLFPDVRRQPTNRQFLFRLADQLSPFRRCG